MRKLAWLVALLLLAVGAEAQDYIKYWPPQVAGVSGGGATFTATVLLPAGSESAPSLVFGTGGPHFYQYGSSNIAWGTAAGNTKGYLGTDLRIAGGSFEAQGGSYRFGAGGGSMDLFLVREAANTLALRNGTTAQTLNVYNSFTTAGSNYGMFSISATATGTDLKGVGIGATIATGAFRSLQGSVAKSLTDAAAAVSFVRIPVVTNGFIGGKVIWTATSSDGTDQLASSAEQFFSGVDKAGTVTCGTGTQTGTATAYSTAKTLTCTVTVATSTTNCDLQVTCTNNTAGTTETTWFNWRLDMPILGAVAIQ